MDTPEEVVREIRAVIGERGYAIAEEVRRVVVAAERNASPSLLVAVGDLIQLLDEPEEFTLADAEHAYLRALKVDPLCAEALAALGFFYDLVMDQPARAKPYFEKAVALGDTESRQGLADVNEQLAGG